MLEGLASVTCEFDLYRFAAEPRVESVVKEDRFRIEKVENLLDYLRQQIFPSGFESLLDVPFDQGRLSVSRFTDGSFPVFYASLESETAESEARHQLAIRITEKTASFCTLYYVKFRCSFRGEVKDIRQMQDDWPDLMHEDDYKFCTGLGVEAARAGLDGLVVPSVRCRGGTNVPVFSRASLHAPVHGELVKFDRPSDSCDDEVGSIP